MAKLPSLFGEFKTLDPFFVGFDDQFHRLAKLQDSYAKSNSPNFPPYNIRKIDDVQYVIEIAVAGFSKDEIDIETKDGSLIVRGEAKEETGEFLFKGIAMRNFIRTFALNELVVVKGADLVNGMLRINLEKVIPDQLKPKKVLIHDGKSTAKSLLTEG